MMTIRNLTILAAAALIVAGCATVTPTAHPAATPVASGASPVPSASATASPASPAPSSAEPTIAPATPTPALTPLAEAVVLEIPQNPVFAGDLVTLTATLTATTSETGGSASLLLSSATLDFGDGTTGMANGSCTARVDLAHSYRQGGDYQPKVIAVSACDPTVAADLSGAYATVFAFPAAPAASASWPACSSFQLHMAGPWTGAGLGNVATRITLRNVGGLGCTLEGYPDVVLVGRDGNLMATHATPATTGAYLFPAVVPHRVALAPGDVASFMIGYTDNPFGAAAKEPYEVACPPSATVRVILPGTHQYGTAAVSMGVCGGAVEVSPIVPGADGIRFP